MLFEFPKTAAYLYVGLAYLKQLELMNEVENYSV